MGLTTARHAARNLSGDLRLNNGPDGGVTDTLVHPV